MNLTILTMAFDLLSAEPTEIAFWTGAGISADPPTSLPLGDDLTQVLTESYCGAATWAQLKHEFGILKIPDDNGMPKQAPRLEATLETMLTCMGPSCLDLLKVLDRPSNSWHDFFAAHLSGGGDHLTVNLDDCIGQSLRQLFPGAPVTVVDALQDVPVGVHSSGPLLTHLHGRIPSGKAPSSALGLSARTISAGLTATARWSIEAVLRRRKWLVIVGYSGRDYFDVNPYIRRLRQERPSYGNLNILWVTYRATGDLSSLRPYTGGSRDCAGFFLETFRSCGAKVWICELLPSLLYETLSQAWNVSQRPSSVGSSLSIHQIKAHAVLVTPDQERLNAAALWISMGFGERAQRILDEIDQNNRNWSHHCCHPYGFSSNTHFAAFLANEAQRELGHYRAATAALNRVAWKSVLDPLIRLQREGGDRWLEGRAVASYVLLSRALRTGVKMRSARKGSSNELSANLIEASVRLLHLYRDILRQFAPLRFLPLPAINRALQILKSEREHLKGLLYDVWYISRLGQELKGRAATTLLHLARALPPVSPSLFPETDNVLGYINTRRFELMQRDTPPMAAEWQDLIRLSERIGDMPGVVKGLLEMGRIGRLSDAQKRACGQAIVAVEWTSTLQAKRLRDLEGM